jgi:hypothetical protein
MVYSDAQKQHKELIVGRKLGHPEPAHDARVRIEHKKRKVRGEESLQSWAGRRVADRHGADQLPLLSNIPLT